MDSQNIDQTNNQENDGALFALFDKYIKINNFLPLQAYLRYIENENVKQWTDVDTYSFVDKKFV